jgi:hypothetical protein
MKKLQFKTIQGNLNNICGLASALNKLGLLNIDQQEIIVDTSTVNYWRNKGAYIGTEYEGGFLKY